MSPAGHRQHSSKKSLHPDPSEMGEDLKTGTSDGAESEESGVCIKKEEMMELDICNHGNILDIPPEVPSIKEENSDNKDYLYCEVCKSFFFNKCEVHGAPLYIADTPVPLGIPDRARQTLPPGLEIQKSSIPDANLGVFNKGETIPAGAHFGPYQGELVGRDEAMNSRYSWVVCRARKCEEYIDGRRETLANWMRYVNCSCKDEEKNLVAFQYHGGILYRCCRPIYPGQELLVYYEKEYAKELSSVFACLWIKKCSMNDEGIQKCHSQEVYVGLQKLSEIKCDLHIPSQGCSNQPTSSHILSSDNSHDAQKEIDCGKSFTQQNDLQQHQRIYTGENKYQYSQCKKKFNQQSSLQEHQYIQKGEKPYHCSQCGKSFTRQRAVHEHQRIHTGEKPYHCSQCGKRFTQQRNLQRHQRVHTGEKPYHCSLCGKSFTQWCNLQKHQRIHTGEKPYQCSQCGKSFTRQAAVHEHQRIHTGEKPYHCLQCGKSFTLQGALHKHERIHTGEKLYHCSQCDRSFIEHGTLRTHQRIHTGEKPYQCSQCGKSFNRQSNLQAHKRIHTGEKPYHCSQCGKSFNRQSNLLKHHRTHTGEKPFQCSQCGKRFSQQSHLQEHQRIHTGEKPFHCSQCGKRFTQQSSLQEHLRIHTGKKPYHCTQCGKSFNKLCHFQKHQCFHIVEKSYHCSQCGETVTSADSFSFKSHKCTNPVLFYDLNLSK